MFISVDVVLAIYRRRSVVESISEGIRQAAVMNMKLSRSIVNVYSAGGGTDRLVSWYDVALLDTENQQYFNYTKAVSPTIQSFQ